LSETAAQERSDDFVCIVYGTGIGAAIVKYADGKPTVRTIEYDKHIQYLRPWQLDCAGKWIKEQYSKPLEDLSETEWAVVMGHFYDHLLTFIRETQPSRLVFGGGVAVKQWPRLQAVFDRLRHENDSLRAFEISLVHCGEDAGLIGALTLLKS
jgi:predicted NBD/HSP70 family sugar kinase